jgi:hypothetical protein
VIGALPLHTFVNCLAENPAKKKRKNYITYNTNVIKKKQKQIVLHKYVPPMWYCNKKKICAHTHTQNDHGVLITKTKQNKQE